MSQASQSGVRCLLLYGRATTARKGDGAPWCAIMGSKGDATGRREREQEGSKTGQAWWGAPFVPVAPRSFDIFIQTTAGSHDQSPPPFLSLRSLLVQPILSPAHSSRAPSPCRSRPRPLEGGTGGGGGSREQESALCIFTCISEFKRDSQHLLQDEPFESLVLADIVVNLIISIINPAETRLDVHSARPGSRLELVCLYQCQMREVS